MTVRLANSEEDARLWQQFVDSHSDCTNYHRWGWKLVIEKSFGWPTFYLIAGEGNNINGILPLVWQKSWIFGSFLTSLPFLNTGGVMAENKRVAEALIENGIVLCKRLGAKYLELRHRQDLGLSMLTKTDKVAVLMEVKPNEEEMIRSLRHEVRTKIRKALKMGLIAEVCGADALHDFYEVFANNMRDLGTPLYGRNFFREILHTFPSETFICSVRYQRKVVAASLMAGFRDTLETIWGSSLREYLPMAPNMLMYWKMICFAGKQGYRFFDFGRSTVGSGPHRFKLQWSTTEVPLFWCYWLRGGTRLPELNPENPRYRWAISVWRKLPVTVTKLIGPRIVRCLP